MKKRNGEIELLRIIFAAVVWLRHGTKLFVGTVPNLFVRGALAVDFFFLVSGWLMAVGCAKKYGEDGGKCQLGRETAGFIRRKYFGLMPEYLIAWAAAFVMYLAGLEQLTKRMFLRECFNWFFELIPLSMTGITGGAFHNAMWYISAMLLAMTVLYPLCRRYYRVFVRYIAPITALVILTFFQIRYGTILDQKVLIGGFIYKGLLRAVAVISFGAALHPVSASLQLKEISDAGKKTLSLVIGLSMGIILYVMLFRTTAELDIFAVCLMAVVVCIVFSRQSYDSAVFDHPICYFLGKNSMLLYMCHSELARFLKLMYKRMLDAGMITIGANRCSAILWILYLILTLALMYAVHLISDFLRTKIHLKS